MDDKKIVDLFFERKEAAISELSVKHGNLFRKIAYNVLGNDADAEECINDAYLAVWNAIPPNQPLSLAAFVSKIVRNIAVTRYHRQTAEKRNSHYDVALDEILDYIPSDDRDSADTTELSEAFNAFLGTLHEEDCALFVKRYWYGESVTDLAAEWEMTPHYISVKLSRTREKLRKFLEKRGISI